MPADAIIHFAYDRPVEDTDARAKRPDGEWASVASEYRPSGYSCHSLEVLVPEGSELPPGSQCGVRVQTSGEWSYWSADTDCIAVPEPGVAISLIAGAIALRFLHWRRR